MGAVLPEGWRHMHDTDYIKVQTIIEAEHVFATCFGVFVLLAFVGRSENLTALEKPHIDCQRLRQYCHTRGT